LEITADTFIQMDMQATISLQRSHTVIAGHIIQEVSLSGENRKSHAITQFHKHFPK